MKASGQFPVIIVILLAIFWGCDILSDESQPEIALTDTVWMLTDYIDHEGYERLSGSKDVYIQFRKDGTWSGSSTNQFWGEYELNGSTIEFCCMGTTLALPPPGSLEIVLLARFGKETEWRWGIEGEVLHLQYDAIATFAPTDAPDLKRAPFRKQDED